MANTSLDENQVGQVFLRCGTIAFTDEKRAVEMRRFTWKLDRDGYVIRKARIDGKKGQVVRMHREVMSAQRGQIVDHIDNNRLNNVASNLRFATKRENTINSLKKPGFSSTKKGVSKIAKNGKWAARIVVNQKGIHLGTFETEDEAAHAYNKAAVSHFGEFACLNPIGVDK